MLQFNLYYTFIGAFVAGVVGRHIPVYTVLGKAIEYAEAVLQVTPTLRILVTKECKAALSRYKGISLEKAGPVMVKVTAITFHFEDL